MQKNYLLIVLALLLPFIAMSQITQTIRGKVIDQETETALIGASIFIPNLEKGINTDAAGRFKLESVPIGRYSIVVSYIGYDDKTLANIRVESGKETVLNIPMTEKAFESEEVVIVADQKNKQEALNEMATVSSRQFRIEETQRYAGARGDISRMATNFAGVSGSNDARNDIVIRGNSPLGLLWRMEGVDIPNPNHFGGFGSSGGPVSMLNNNVLANSDFFTGAFPAEYGNANSGAFDLKLRNGNDEKYEFLGQIGFNGFELGAEGPIKKERNSSFLANYRYSTLSFFDVLGINFGYVGIPNFQDLSFKINAPNSPIGNISVFGMGGMSSIQMLEKEREEGELNINNGSDLENGVDMGVIGIKHRYLINDHSFTQLTVSSTILQEQTRIDNVDSVGEKTDLDYLSNFLQQRQAAKLVYQNKISPRLTVKAGITGNYFTSNMVDSFKNDEDNYQILRDIDSQAFLTQTFGQFKYLLSPKWTAVGGLYSQYLNFNHHISIEPRLAFQYQMRPNQKLSMAYGRHAQLQPFTIYFGQTQIGTDQYIETNNDLDFTYSNHFVLGYDYSISADWRVKAEAYYQYITNAPVERDASSFSLLNFGADFGNPNVDSLVNKGIGRNYGVELTLEKFFSDNYYLLLTASIFNSEYQGSDEVWRSTAFNTNYVVNALYGMEFPLGKKKNNFIAIDLKMGLSGGRRYTPVDETQTLLDGELVYLDDEAFSEQFKAYFKPDIQITFRNNMKNYSQMWAISVENFVNRQNVFRQIYDTSSNQLETEYQLGLFPVFLYKIQF